MYKKNAKLNKYRRMFNQEVPILVPAFKKLNTECSMIKESENLKNPVEVINTGFPKITATDTSNNSTMDFI